MGLTNADIEKIKGIFSDQFLQIVAEKVAKIVERELEDRIKAQENIIVNLQSEVEGLKRYKEESEVRSDNHEQGSRAMNVRIFGIPYEERENLLGKVLDLFNKKLKCNIKDIHIKKCHRVSSKIPSDKPPSILVKFVCDSERMAVLRNRKHLKKSGINIKEDLTKVRLNLLNEAINKFSYKNAWCLNGIVYVKSESGVHRINKKSDLSAL